MGILEAVGLGGILGKLAAFGGTILAILIAWWAKGKAGERKGLRQAAEAARERERSAVEEVMRQRGRPGPEPFGGLRHTQKPVREPADPPGGDKPAT